MALVILIVAVDGLTVVPVPGAFQNDVTVHSPLPSVIVLVPLPLADNDLIVTLLLLASKVPVVTPISRLDVYASPNLNVPVTAFAAAVNVIVLPAVVKTIVPRPAKFCWPAPDTVTPDPRV